MHKVAEAVIDSLIPAIVQIRDDGTAKITNSTQSEIDGSSNSTKSNSNDTKKEDSSEETQSKGKSNKGNKSKDSEGNDKQA